MLPVTSTAFAEQQWPGKEEEDKGEKDEPEQSKQDEDSRKEMSPEQKYLHQQLLEEVETMRNFQNNDGKPDGDLKLLDKDAIQQLESGLSVEDQ